MLFANINKGINCNIFLWLCCLPPDPPVSYLQYGTKPYLPAHALALLGFFPIIDPCRYFFTSVVIRPWQTFCDFQHKYRIQKESMDPSSFEVWNKNIFSLTPKWNAQPKMINSLCTWNAKRCYLDELTYQIELIQDNLRMTTSCSFYAQYSYDFTLLVWKRVNKKVSYCIIRLFII